jgi:hypothetical protein
MAKREKYVNILQIMDTKELDDLEHANKVVISLM